MPAVVGLICTQSNRPACPSAHAFSWLYDSERLSGLEPTSVIFAIGVNALAKSASDGFFDTSAADRIERTNFKPAAALEA